MTAMPEPQPLVSVIVSPGSDERRLHAALESVFAQDHAPIEIVVIESGLGDQRAQMARGYLGQERVRSRVRRAAFVAAEADTDLPAALNRAVLESHGEYIGLLNGDERFAAGRLTALLGACVSNGAQIAFSRVEPVAGETAPSAAELEHLYSVQDNIEFFPTVGYALLRQPCMLSTGNLFFRRSLVDRVGGFAALPHAYAWDFALRCLLMTEPLFVATPLDFYPRARPRRVPGAAGTAGDRGRACGARLPVPVPEPAGRQPAGAIAGLGAVVRLVRPGLAARSIPRDSLIRSAQRR